ncbi:MAG TPA: class I SAM-dependent methyltransferase [Desulfobacterales bacterium]|nr:class I SAM-dependent methyltransferase [Desulfobacterales bacterium]
MKLIKKKIKGLCGKIITAFYGLFAIGLKKGTHLTRFAMYEHLRKVLAPIKKAELNVLSISDSLDLCIYLGFEKDRITDVSYPEYDVLSLPFEDDSFDVIVSDQVLEHVQGNPEKIFDESFRIVRPGGLIIHTTCFINPIHKSPGDYYRFTPDGLKYLAEKKGIVRDFGGWGYYFMWFFVGLGMRYVRIPFCRFHPYHWIATVNSKKWPVVTWVYLQKPEK